MHICTPERYNRSLTTSDIQGLEWAIENGVDVVCMSWAIVQPHAAAVSNPDIQDLQQKLKEASEKMLLFGAACDEGNNLGENMHVLPGMHPDVFYIGAADNSGNLNPHVEKAAQFAFPGGDGSDDYKGSSFANALAAGLAALLLHCAEVSGYHNGPTAQKSRKLMRSYPVMVKIFRNMCESRDSKYLQVWSNLNVEHARRDTTGSHFESQIKAILK